MYRDRGGVEKMNEEEICNRFYQNFEGNKNRVKEEISTHLINKHHFKTVWGKRSQEIFYYTEGIYKDGGIAIIRQEIEKILKEKLTINYQKEIINKIKNRTIIDAEKIEEEDNFICLNNGLWDIEHKELIRHTPEKIFLSKLNIDYEPNADCAKIENFMKQLFDTQKKIDTIQEIAGYILLRSNYLKKAFIFKGKRDTGKTTLLDLFEGIVGENNVSRESLQNLCDDKHSSINLMGKLLNVYDDLNRKFIKNPSEFKNITGDARRIRGERKFCDPVLFKNYATLIFACNSLPSIDGTIDEAFLSRFIILEFNKVIPIWKRDKNLKYKLLEEKSGFLIWALSGLDRLNRNKKFSFEITPKEVYNEFTIHNTILGNFVIDRIDKRKGNIISKTELYNEYVKYYMNQKKEWQKEEFYEIKKFGKKLKNIITDLSDIKREGKKYWKNIILIQ